MEPSLLLWRYCIRAGVATALFLTLSAMAAAQTVGCISSAALPTIHSEGLTEQIGDIALTCSGGTAGVGASIGVFITLNTNVTNRLDVNGAPLGIAVTSSAVLAGAVAVSLNGPTTVFVQNVNYVIPAPSSTQVTITIHGILAAAGVLANGAGSSFVSASFLGFGMQYNGLTSVPVAQTSPTLLYSANNNGIPCAGAAVPATFDFPGFLAATFSSSAVRITEGAVNSFAAQGTGQDTGVRIVVQFSGYGSGVRLFVPDAIVGNSSPTPTSGGEFGTAAVGGTFLGGSSELLLSRVNGASSNGIGGTLAISLPGVTTPYTSMTELQVSGGAAFVVYEVISANPLVRESAQVPVFLVTAANNCASSAQTNLVPSLVPVSTVTVATATDPIPRFVANTPGPDCQVFSDCSGSYFPMLSVSTTPITLNGASLGNPRTATLGVTNVGGSQMPFQVSIAYQSGSGWLSVTPTSGVNSTTLTVTASPAALQPGTFNATITVNAGSAGTASVVATFNVGPQGPLIQALVNAASFKPGPISSGSYVALFGVDLAGTNVGVTFNGLAGTVVYDSATQINLIVPNLGVQQGANVIATIGTQVSDPFVVALTPNVPGIFTPGIVNANGTVNSASNPAPRGTSIAIYMTGLFNPLTGPVTVNMGSTAAGTGLVPSFAGPQGTLPALDQVNVAIPASLTLTGNSVPLGVCVVDYTGNVCSNQVSLFLQ